MARPLYGLTDQVLLDARRTAQDDYLRGSTIVSTGAGDISTALTIQRDAVTRINEINRELIARGHPEAPQAVCHTDNFVTPKFV